MKNFKKFIGAAVLALIWLALNLYLSGSEILIGWFGVKTFIILLLVLNFLTGSLIGVLLFVENPQILKRLIKLLRILIPKTAWVFHKLSDLLRIPTRQPRAGTSFSFTSLFKNFHKKLIWQFKKIIVKYNIKREYFTILLPLILAAILLGLSTFSETFSIFPEEKAPDSFNQSSETIKVESTANPYKNLDQMIVIATLILITPYSIDVYIAQKRRKRYEEEFAGFLYELSELLRGGLDPVSAIREIASPTVQSERSLRALGPHLKKAAALLDWGRPFETVIARLAESLKSRLISKYSYLIVEASRMGGANATTILKSSQDLEKTIQLEREKDGMMKEYLYIIFAAQFILVGILYLLNSTLLPSIMSMLKSGVGSAFGISAAATNIDFKKGFFHVIMINAFASGIIAGQLTEGKARHGLKYSVILMTISYAVSIIFLL